MRILFVCRANMFRSQIAGAFFKKFCDKHEVESVGTLVNKEEGQKLKERNEKEVKLIIKVMKEVGIDIGENKIKQITLEMVEWADKIICMAQKETIPDYLTESNKVICWDVKDAVHGSDYEFFVKSRDKIERLVKGLVKEIC